MSVLMSPKSFDGVMLNGSAGISSSAFSVPYPTVDSKIRRAAGGWMIDLDYGDDAALLPAPFSVTLYFKATSAANLGYYVDLLLSPPSKGGKLGSSGYFQAVEHGSSTVWQCTAQLQAPGVRINGRGFGPGQTRLGGVNVTFIPTILFVEI